MVIHLFIYLCKIQFPNLTSQLRYNAILFTNAITTIAITITATKLLDPARQPVNAFEADHVLVVHAVVDVVWVVGVVRVDGSESRSGR